MEKSFLKEYKFYDIKFWQNFWFYHKYKILLSIVALLFILFVIRSCVNTVRPDLTLMYIGETPIYSELKDKMQIKLSNYVDDINKDRKKDVFMLSLLYDSTAKTQEAGFILQKADIEIAAGDSDIILIDGKLIDRYMRMDMFSDITSIASDANISSDRVLFKNNTNSVSAIDITNTKFAKDLGFTGDRLFVGIRLVPAVKKNDELAKNMYSEAQKLFELLIKDEIK